MANRFLDWLRQANADHKHALHSFEDGDYEWSCFASQQAAEKAIKALFMRLGQDAWGHTLSALLGNLPTQCEPSAALLDQAKSLDKHYIPTRYPNGFDSGAPTDFYTREEAKAALEYAEKIIAFCCHQIDLTGDSDPSRGMPSQGDPRDPS